MALFRPNEFSSSATIATQQRAALVNFTTFNVFRMLIAVRLAFVLLASTPVAVAESHAEYYNYEIEANSNGEGAPTSYVGFESGVESSRERRFVGKEPAEEMAATAASVASSQPVMKTSAGSVTVAYSTEKLMASSSGRNASTTAAGGVRPTSVEPSVDVRPTLPSTPVVVVDATTEKMEIRPVDVGIIVSNPMNPANEQPTNVHVWANQTRWANATGKKEEKAKTMGGPETTSLDGSPETSQGGPKNPVKIDEKLGKKNATVAGSPTTNSSTPDEADLGDISISKFSDVTNNTLAQNNITKTEEDTHKYYNSTFFSDENIAKMYWVDMDNHPDRQVNDLLSQSHRRAATVKLKFDFPFYGHKVRNITIATGGFLYTGEYVHSWLAATQYIAPLMANFDTRISNDSWVKYADNGTAFTVEWERVVLQDRPEAGGFTFQATLHDNGNIVFVYSKIPLTVEAIEDTTHPVKVGLSDAYIMDRTIFFVRRKTIYEYHRVNFNHQEIKNWTVIYLRALPTCLEMENCEDCLTKVPEFACKWCPESRQCSTGTFRFRQNWLEKGCEQRNIREKNSCPAGTVAGSPSNRQFSDNFHGTEDHPGHVRSDTSFGANVDENVPLSKNSPGPSVLEHAASHMNMGVSGIIGILIVVSLITGMAAWAGYAYRNPHSTSGQMLIRYRPSQWSWRRGEARYTAATIHM